MTYTFVQFLGESSISENWIAGDDRRLDLHPYEAIVKASNRHQFVATDTWHLHMGMYAETKQLTLLADGCKYTRERPPGSLIGGGDRLGQWVASGTWREMLTMMYDYARMLT